MITLGKFFNALERVKAGGHWSMGLIIADADAEAVDFTSLKNDKEKIIIDGAPSPELAIKKMVEILAAGEWIILEIKNSLPSEVYNQLRLLSSQNRLQLADGAVICQPDTSRVVAVVSASTIKNIEVAYPDFKFSFGPIINL